MGMIKTLVVVVVIGVIAVAGLVYVGANDKAGDNKMVASLYQTTVIQKIVSVWGGALPGSIDGAVNLDGIVQYSSNGLIRRIASPVGMLHTEDARGVVRNCVATLISPNRIITAAECVVGSRGVGNLRGAIFVSHSELLKVSTSNNYCTLKDNGNENCIGFIVNFDVPVYEGPYDTVLRESASSKMPIVVLNIVDVRWGNQGKAHAHISVDKPRLGQRMIGLDLSPPSSGASLSRTDCSIRDVTVDGSYFDFDCTNQTKALGSPLFDLGSGALVGISVYNGRTIGGYNAVWAGTFSTALSVAVPAEKTGASDPITVPPEGAEQGD